MFSLYKKMFIVGAFACCSTAGAFMKLEEKTPPPVVLYANPLDPYIMIEAFINSTEPREIEDPADPEKTTKKPAPENSTALVLIVLNDHHRAQRPEIMQASKQQLFAGHSCTRFS
jgi:hypothetical protein